MSATSLSVGQTGKRLFEGGVDDVEEVRDGLVVPELFADLDDDREVPLQGAHVRLRHHERGPLQAWIGDVGAEHPPRYDLGLDA